MSQKTIIPSTKRITILRRIVQISAFLFINYVIIEMIFSINLISFEGLIKILPVLNSPRNPLSDGAGIMEYIFYFIAEGEFPFLLFGILILIILFSGRFFCGWICPIGTIQDALSAIPTKERKIRDTESHLISHRNLLNLKFLIIIAIAIVIFPLGITKTTDLVFYFQYKRNIGQMAQKPLGYFSLSEFIFNSFPDFIKNSWERKRLDLPELTNPFEDFSGFLDFSIALFYIIFYIIVIILAIFYPRFYCRYLCPFAGVAAAISDYSFLKLSRNPVRCVGRAKCGICERVCPKQIRILDEPFEFFTGKGECNLCLKCKEKCPYYAIELKFG
ncbi:MAG: 4Fe-4S binding protein [Promethearchaeia archaeon]